MATTTGLALNCANSALYMAVSTLQTCNMVAAVAGYKPSSAEGALCRVACQVCIVAALPIFYRETEGRSTCGPASAAMPACFMQIAVLSCQHSPPHNDMSGDAMKFQHYTLSLTPVLLCCAELQPDRAQRALLPAAHRRLPHAGGHHHRLLRPGLHAVHRG